MNLKYRCLFFFTFFQRLMCWEVQFSSEIYECLYWILSLGAEYYVSVLNCMTLICLLCCVILFQIPGRQCSQRGYLCENLVFRKLRKSDLLSGLPLNKDFIRLTIKYSQHQRYEKICIDNKKISVVFPEKLAEVLRRFYISFVYYFVVERF